jgi:hypothetical protein
VIVALLMLLQVAPGASVPLPSAAEAAEQDIEVIGRKLRLLRLNLSMNERRLTGCAVAVSSTDRFVDAQACKAAYACVMSGVAESRRLLNCINGRIVEAVARHDTEQNSEG